MNEAYPFNLNHLRYFFEVARAGNMRRAASRIGISQPALSKQIQALEDAIGLQLFYRSSKGLQPTPDGEIAYAHCQRVFGHLYDLEEAIDVLRSGSAGRVTIGAIPSISVHILPSVLRRFRTTHEKVRIRVQTTRSAQVLAALREHRVDVGFVAGQPTDAGLTAVRFRDSPMVVVTSPNHPWADAVADGRALPREFLDRADMVAFDQPAPTRKFTDEAFDELDVDPRVMAECPSIETIKKMVQSELGFAVLPEHCVADEFQRGELTRIPVDGWCLSRSLYLVHRSAPQLPPAVRHFVSLIPPGG